MGIIFGSRMSLGLSIGLLVCGLQLNISSWISGSIWSTVKKEISIGGLKDEEMNNIKPDSSWNKAAAVGNEIGNVLKDMVSLTLGTYTLYICGMSCCLGRWFEAIHS